MGTAVMPAVRPRSVIVVSPDAELRLRVEQQLRSGRWDVYPANGGAEAMVHLTGVTPEAMIVDHWLPDLDAAEFASYVGSMCPSTEMLRMDGGVDPGRVRSTRRSELLHALREAQDSMPAGSVHRDEPVPAAPASVLPGPVALPSPQPAVSTSSEIRMHLPDVVGDTPGMRELAREIRLVAPHLANVLILGETGTGKELAAKAVHRLSTRGSKPFVVLNCAAIPEHLLEAELFGHTRGAFTGAVSSRTGRIEAAHGGTLFLDEIGEMPLALQAKMLRFLENGEIQKVGENESMRVDVRIVAATHQPLEQHAEEQRFRLDLFHRLAAFPVEIPPLRERLDDLAMLVEYLLCKLGEASPRKVISSEALSLLASYHWPGNVRELAHSMQRATILCGEDQVIQAEHLRLGRHKRSAANSIAIH